MSISQPELASCGSTLQLFARLSSVELAIVKKNTHRSGSKSYFLLLQHIKVVTLLLLQ